MILIFDLWNLKDMFQYGVKCLLVMAYHKLNLQHFPELNSPVSHSHREVRKKQ